MIKEFHLGATKWSVEEIEKFERTTQLGLCSFGESKIFLSKTWDNTIVSDGSKENTLYHEAVHAILATMGEHTLNENEQFVQQFGTLMHQFVETKK